MLWVIMICLLGMVLASPHPQGVSSINNNNNNNNRNRNFCPVVKKVVTVFKQERAASRFCSSFLKIETVTVAPNPGPCQASPVVIPAPEARQMALPGARAEPKPAAFRAYQKQSAISSACSCVFTHTTKATVIEGDQPAPTPPSTFRIQAVEPEETILEDRPVVFAGNFAQAGPNRNFPEVYFDAPPTAPETGLSFSFIPGTSNIETSFQNRMLATVDRTGRIEAGDDFIELLTQEQLDDPEIRAGLPIECTIDPQLDQTCTLNCIRPGFAADRTHIDVLDGGSAVWEISDTGFVLPGYGETRFRAIVVEV